MSARFDSLNPKNTVFMLCDVQERFREMNNFDTIVANTKTLLHAGKILEVPLIVTEQYPEKLGYTIKDLQISHATKHVEKTLFSMLIPEVKNKLIEMQAEELYSVVLFGLETHICIEQTAIDLRVMGLEVHIVADCTISRLLQDRILALERLKQIGCFVTSFENVIFKLLRDVNNPKFTEIWQLFPEFIS